MLGRTRKKPGTPGNPLVAPLTVISPKPPPILFPRILSSMSTPFRLIKPSFIDHSRRGSLGDVALPFTPFDARCSTLLAAASVVPRFILDIFCYLMFEYLIMKNRRKITGLIYRKDLYFRQLSL